MLHSGDNESLELSLDMNEALAEMQMNQPWCNECQNLKQSVEDLRAACSHQATIISGLKEKIIPTDQLITDFYAKQEENQMLSKSLETCRRQCEELGQQLHSALARFEPLREANGKFERHIQRCEQDIEKLKAENESYKICQQQSNAGHYSLLEKIKKLEEEKREGQGSLRKSEARLKKLQDDMAVRKKENSEVKKENTCLQNEVKVLKAQLEKFKNIAVPCKPASRNLEIQSPSPRGFPGFYDDEIASLLTCPLLQMLPPILSPIPSSDAELSDGDASDNELSINHFATELEAKLGCSDYNFLRPQEHNDDIDKDIDEDSDDDDECDDDETDFIPIGCEADVSKNSRELATGRQLESQTSIGFETLTDEDGLTPQVANRVPGCSSLASSSSVPPTVSALESVPSDPPMHRVTTEIKAGGFARSSAELPSSSSTSGISANIESSSANVLSLKIDNKCQGLLSATQSSSYPVGEHQCQSTISSCSSSSSSSSFSSAAVTSCTSTVFTSSSFVSVSGTCRAVSSMPLNSFQSFSSMASTCLSSSNPKSVGTPEVSGAPIVSSEVMASPSSPSMSSSGATLSSPFACDVTENSLPPSSATAVPSSNQNSSAVFDFAASTNVPLSSACVSVGASDVLSHCASHEIPVTSACVSATSSGLSNNVSPSSLCASVVTQHAGVVISDSVPHSSSGVNSGTSNGAVLTSAVVNVATVPPLLPCAMDMCSSMSSSALPCVSVVISSASNSFSSVGVVTCDTVPRCSPSVTAEACGTADNASLLSCVSVVASTPTTCDSVLAYPCGVSLSNSAMSCSASLSSQCISASSPTSLSFPSCESRFASGSALLAPASVPVMNASKPEVTLNLSSLRAQMSIEDIFKHVSISPPLSPIHSPPKPETETVPWKSLDSTDTSHSYPRTDTDLPSAASMQVSSPPPVAVSGDSTINTRKKLSSSSSLNRPSSEIATRSKAVKQKSSMLDDCPIPKRALRNNSAAVVEPVACGEADSTGRLQSRLPQFESLLREKENAEVPVKANAVDPQTLPLSSNPAVVLPTSQTSDCSELIESVIKAALMLSEDVIPMWFNRCYHGQAPTSESWLTPSQSKLFADVCRPVDITVLKEFCNRAVQVLSLKGDGVVTSGNTALCCIFVSICRILGDVERVRVFVYDAVKRHLFGYASLITAVAAMWPLPLQLASCSLDFGPVLYVLQHAIFAKSLDSSKPKHQKMRFCLERLCGWRLPLETVDEIARHLLSHLKDVVKQTTSSPQEGTWNVELAFDLLCVTEGWQWSNNFVVVQLLWPVLGGWAANPAEAKDQPFIEAVIGILGRVVSHCPAACRSNTDHILNILLTLLKEPTVAVAIQLSVLRALLLLAKYQPDRCATMCLQWVKDHRSDLDPITKAMLQDFHKQFSPKLKYLSELVID